MEDEWDKTWGDTLTRKDKSNKSSLRIVFWNCGGFPIDSANPKNQVIRNALIDTQADIAALAETNTSWKMAKPHDRLHERTWSWFPSLHISYSYASDFPAATPQLAGGTAILTTNDTVHQVADKSNDSLGRWSSTLIRGRQDRSLRVISAYRCVKNIHGPLSVWSQQRYLLDLQKCTDDPIDKFDTDLQLFLQECMAAGEIIVLGIDVNEDIRVGEFTKKMSLLGLVDICTHKHGALGPPTYSRGSVPIDAIYVSSMLCGSECGYLQIVSDHRILWLDIPHEIAFGRKISSLPTKSPQRLILQDPRVVHKYITCLQTFLQSHQFLEKVSTLHRQMHINGCTAESVKQYNELDHIRREGILLANKRCRKLKMGEVPFSPTLVIAWNRIKALQVIQKKLSGRRVCSRFLHRAVKAANLSIDLATTTTSDVKQELSKAWTTYKTLKKQASVLRSSWLEEIAVARTADGKTALAQEIKNLMVRESQRREARQIKFVLKPTNRRGLSSIEIQDGNGNWFEVTCKNEIEEALLQELRNRFNQASATPFQTEPLLSEVGPLGTSTASKAILAGTYKPPLHTDEWAEKLIPFLRQVIDTVNAEDLSPAQYAASWKKVREKTSAGPSGITIPHMKAHGTSSYMTQVDTIMANLPFRFGFSPMRWRKGLDVMLEKKPGVRQLSTLRAILLYEADFNQNNKRLGRDMLYRAEDGNAVAIEQYGSRKHMSATDQSLNKALTFDIWRQLRQRGALCSNDAKACYDRIAHNCASLCLQRVGTPCEPIISMFQTIQQLEHHVRTVFGESKIHFIQKDETPLQGVGQGNGAGPQIWALVSTPVLNMLRAQGLGAVFHSALTCLSTTLVGFAFVDDTDLVTSGPRMGLDEVLQRIQRALTAWEGGIRATGGAIEPKKSHWYIVDFGWKDGQPVYRSTNETGGQLRVRDPMGVIQSLKQLQPWEAERTLGVRLAPDGNMTTQFEWMLATARKWADTIRSGYLPRHLTWQAWRTTICKTMEYPLPTTTLSRQQCDKLTSTIATVALPRSGIMRSFPRALVHAPIKAGGLNIPNLYVEQGISHITKLIRYSKARRHATGVLLRHSCEALKLELGCNGFLLDNPWILSVMATESWIKSTWQFAQEYGISIQDDIEDFHPLRENDQLLIPTFVRLGYRGSELIKLNQCRLFLKVTWLSEVATGDGKMMERSAIAPPFVLHIKEQYFYPTQICPPDASWSIWVTALLRLCDSGRVLKKPLGRFLRDDAIMWWLDPGSNRLYCITDKGIEMFRKTPGKRTRAMESRFTYSGITNELPRQRLPATACRSNEIAYVTGTGVIGHRPCAMQITQSWVLESVDLPSNLWDEWPQSDVELQAVSDGSFKEQHGTAAWMIIVSPLCDIRGRCITPGSPEIQSAYRSELAGLYCIAYYVHYLERTHGVSGRITVACDGISALNQASKNYDFINPNVPQFDLIMAIRSVVAETTWVWTWKHVKGHQDDTRANSELDHWSKWNIQMDAEAKRYWLETKHQSIYSNIYGEPWRTIIQGKKVTLQFREMLREACTLPAAMEYWDRKNRFGNKNTAAIDWDILGVAMSALPLQRQHWISKTISGFCSTGVMMKRRKERQTDECPRCGESEDVEHIWRCQYDTQEIWNKSMANLKEWLLRNETHPALSSLILDGLEGWRTGLGLQSVRPSWLNKLAEQQSQCGWRNFFEGFWVKEWRVESQVHLSRIKSKRSSKRWTSALIRKLWQVAWDLWEHRNGYLHANENSILTRQLDEEIAHQFGLGTRGLDNNAKALFLKGAQDVQRKPVEIKQQWVRRVTAAREMMELGATGGFQAERTMMARWLQKQG